MPKPIVVSQEDVDRGVRDDPARCPFASALGRESNAEVWEQIQGVLAQGGHKGAASVLSGGD